ncbi:RHS repeat-associated core domain-containing protein [Variovorax sp. Sphag1AA]|uniref:RHS repeat-associated core domain-containing protein n=1 Tax=Variovorax sp. Sphag1AA TaxID=2587027 RepID=UPI00160A3B73|nr:RHS repeat-associated core domain-containing protein [Variovorax sp. Sphag1AA]MBB3178448.1 RHS repeat-associated protein [Variovorax sp. Sphag1AA]
MNRAFAVWAKLRRARVHVRAALGLAITLATTAVTAQSVTVTPPNGTLTTEVADLSVQTSAGPVEWKRTFNGVGWRFNRHWDGISASYKPVMTQNDGGGSPSVASAGFSGAPAVCWIWVDEDWQPGDAVVGFNPGGALEPVPVDPASRAGDLLEYTDPKGRVWRYAYDADGNVLSETDPLGHATSYVYDKKGNLSSATDERGKTYQFAYDAGNRQTQRTDPLGGDYRTSFNVLGVMSSVTDASGKAMSLDYDAMVRLTKATDSKGQTYALDYADPDGSEKNANRPTRLSYPTFQRIMRYNTRERLTLRNDQAGAETRIESFTWDGAGRNKTYTDANGKTKFYAYNPFGEVNEVKDPLGNTMRLLRDTRGNVIEVIDPNGKATRMAYDRRNLLADSTDPLGKTTRYTYNENGWLASIVQANGQSVTYDFDAIGRVTTQREYDISATLVKTTSFTYDDAGNLLAWDDGTYSSSRSYDDADRLSGETVKYGAFELAHSYTYHANGQIKTYAGPDGATISYDYDGAAQLQRVDIPGAGVLSVADWQWFQPKKVILPGGTEQRMEYDGYQSLTRLKVVNPTQATVFDLQNQFGKLAEIKKATFDGVGLEYTHDDAGRLTAIGASLLSRRGETFTLDANSNRKTHSKTGSGLWVYDDAGQLTQRPSAGGSGTVTYEYDDAGNLIQKTDTSKSEPARTTRYGWDALNRLAEARDGANALIARYAYDPFDRRIRKQMGDSAPLNAAGPGGSDIRNSVTHYLQSEWGTLAETDAAGQVQIAYGWSPQRESSVAPVFARLHDVGDSWRTVYYHNDHLGTPQRITDHSGAVVWSATYDAFGKATTQTTSEPATAVVSNLRLPGQYWDAETGLHYNDRRYYDPDTGRYTARDPLGFEGGINLYTYAAGAPGRYSDPTGEIIPCLAANYVRCMAMCGLQSLAMQGLDRATGGCNEFDLMGAAKDCAVDCLWAMLPIPDPCGKFGKLFSTAIGLGAGLMNSFPGETLVHVRDVNGKPSLKAIAEIRIGDEVLAWDEMALVDGQLSQSRPIGLQTSASSARPVNATRYEKVNEIATSEKQQRLVHLTLATGEKLTATDGHPFRTSEGWRDAILLKKGGKLLLRGSGEGDDDPATVTIADVQVETKVVRVFNLEVDNLHTFFVGEEGVVVHNGARGTKPPAPGRPGPGDGFVPSPGSGHYKYWPHVKCKGWRDKKGDVWEPTDHNGTHAPHWDVQHPDGTHTPTYPSKKYSAK